MDLNSRPGPEPTTLEAVGDQWRYTLVVVQAGDDDDDCSVVKVAGRLSPSTQQTWVQLCCHQYVINGGKMIGGSQNCSQVLVNVLPSHLGRHI